MAYVPGFEHDVFISYAHVDDEPDVKGEDGWVTTLVSTLQNRLAKLLGRREAFSLWMDQQLARHVRITPEIVTTLENTATLVAVLSPAYLASPWCTRERETFLKIVNERVKSGSSVFIVECNKVELEDRPDEFGDLIGYRFWIQDPLGGAPRTLGTPRPKPDENEYYDMLTDLAWQLAEELKRLRRARMKSPTLREKSPLGEDKKAATVTIFLAEVTDDLDHLRTKLKRSFEQQEFRVVPNVSLYPREPQAFREAVTKDLLDAALFVQLLSPVPGRRLMDTAEESYVSYQHDCARERELPIFQWRDPGRDLEEISRAVANAHHLHLLQGPSVQARPINDFIQDMIEKARRISATEPGIPSATGGAILFVDVESHDHALAAELCGYLAKKGYTLFTPIESVRPHEIREDFEHRVKECQAFIIIYGQTASAWVRERYAKAKKLERLREHPFLGLAVYEGPPKPKDPINVWDQNLKIVHCEDGLDPNKLEPFLEVLKEGLRTWMAKNGKDKH